MNSSKKTDLNQPTLIQAIGAILVAAVMWGSGNVLSRSLLIEGINEIFLVTLRVTLIGTILFLNYFLFIREKFQITIFKEATITGTFSVFSVSWFFIYALQYISSGLVTLLISSAPIFTALWLKVLLKEEKISKLKYISIATGFVGILYLFATGETGLVIILSITAYLIFDISPQQLSTSQIIRVAALVVSNLSAFTAFTWLIRRVSALQVASVDYLVPIVGVTAGVVFLNESFNSNVIVAAVFIFISLLMNTKEEFSN